MAGYRETASYPGPEETNNKACEQSTAGGYDSEIDSDNSGTEITEIDDDDEGDSVNGQWRGNIMQRRAFIKIIPFSTYHPLVEEPTKYMISTSQAFEKILGRAASGRLLRDWNETDPVIPARRILYLLPPYKGIFADWISDPAWAKCHRASLREEGKWRELRSLQDRSYQRQHHVESWCSGRTGCVGTLHLDVVGNPTGHGKAYLAVLVDFDLVMSDSVEIGVVGVRLIFRLFDRNQNRFAFDRIDLFDDSFVDEPKSRGLDFPARPEQKAPHPLEQSQPPPYNPEKCAASFV
jgi:hypothetical protein